MTFSCFPLKTVGKTAVTGDQWGWRWCKHVGHWQNTFFFFFTGKLAIFLVFYELMQFIVIPFADLLCKYVLIFLTTQNICGLNDSYTVCSYLIQAATLEDRMSAAVAEKET